MKTYLDCIPCFFRQALEAARITGEDEKTQKKILDEVAKALPDFLLSASPPEMARKIHGIVKEITGINDPYAEIKKQSNKLALSVYPDLRKKLEKSPDRLLIAVELAIAGNVIDYGVKNTLDVDGEVAKILSAENKAIKNESEENFNYSQFKKDLLDAKEILYLADNAGEVVFDRIIIEEIKSLDSNKRVIYAVKEKPTINDALIEDAIFCKIDKTAEIISSGSDAPGTILSLCSEDFLKIFKKADLVISKGQGNFETLSHVKRPVYYLFMAKCPVIANDVGCKVGDIILLQKSG